MISSDPADNTQADHTQQTETVVPKKRQISVPMDERPSEPDPFGQVFSGPDYTKLPAADLLRPQNHQLDMICDLGYAPKVGEAGPGFFGAAYLSLLLFNISPFRGRLTEFFDWAVERLADAAEASRDLAEFIHALNPNITCTKTEAGWEIYYGGVIRMHWGARPIDVTHYVERFISVSKVLPLIDMNSLCVEDMVR